MSIQIDIRGRIAVIMLDFPPVNSLSAALRTALGGALDAAKADNRVQGIVISGHARAFSAGADVKEFGTEAAVREPRLATLIDVLESCPKPVVAAINGICLGGGLELALGAHFRVAHSQARVGLPEVKLGLLPGAGGTQRLPRAVGLETGLDMIVSGKIVSAYSLRQTPLFDTVTDDDPIAAAVDLCLSVLAGRQPLPRLRDMPILDDDPGVLDRFRQKAASAANRFPAPLQCVEAVGWCLGTPFDIALRQEREAFASLIASPASRALRHAFAAERAASKLKGLELATAGEIAHVGVVGTGTMGCGIAMACANAGLQVTVMDTSHEALDRAQTTIRKYYEASARKGRISDEQAGQCLDRIKPANEYGGLAHADVLIEAVFEDMAVKQSVFERLDAICKPGAILASNTSFLNLDDLARCTRRPHDVVGLHFFSPAHVMRLVEVIRGAQTSPGTLASSLALVRRLGKIGVVSGVCDGFIVNRMGFRYTAAAFGSVARGAAPQQVDSALETFGMAMGPLRMGDLAGLDIGWATRQRKAAAAGAPSKPVVPDKLCEHGRFGQKTGAGWYRYENGQRAPLPDPAAERLIDEFRREQGIVPGAVDQREIVERCLFALINEGARVLEDGIAARASDIDLAFLNGYGFPAHVGGPMLYADSVGLPHVVAALQRFADDDGADPSWAPAPLLVRLAQGGRTFN